MYKCYLLYLYPTLNENHRILSSLNTRKRQKSCILLIHGKSRIDIVELQSISNHWVLNHYTDVTMSGMASQITDILDCLLNRLLKLTSKKMSAILNLCEGNPPVTGGFPSQRASNTGRVSMSWRHHATTKHTDTSGKYLPFKFVTFNKYNTWMT